MFTTIACSQNSDDSPRVAQVPENIPFQKPTPGPMLTEEQAKIIKKKFKDRQMMILPPGELVFNPDQLSAEERARKEKELKLRDRNSYDMLMEVRSDCVTQMPPIAVSSSLPKNPDGTYNGENIKAGDFVKSTGSASISGGNCLANLNTNFNASFDVINFDREKRRLDLGSNASGSLGFELLDTKYQQLLNLKKLLVQTGLSGTMIAMDASQKTYVTTDLQIDYITSDSVVKASGVYKVLVSSRKSENQNLTKSDTVVSLKLNIDNDEIRIDVRSIGNETGEPNTEIYINGNLTSEQELADLFGENSPELISKSLSKSFM